jgi:MerR family transcriptional regulator, light-induced transcriptional regulator
MAENRAAEPDDDDLLTLQEAADALKVHYMTAYRWVRRGELPAFKAGGRLRVRAADMAAFVRDREVDTALPAREHRRTDWPTHVERLYHHLMEGAAADASALVRKVIADGAPVGDVYIRLIAPALHRIGEEWAQGRITIPEEHRATEIVAGITARLGDHFRRRGPARGSAITLTPPGDAHALAAGMVADFLRGGGYDVHHLGANVPAEDLRLFVSMVEPDAVCISVTRTDLPEGVLADLAGVAREREGVLVIVGGQGVDAATAEGVGAIHVADLEELTDRLTAHLSAAP